MTLDQIVIQALGLLGLFVAGAVSWSLALYRLLAFERRQVNLLSALIFIEEFGLLFLGVWLAYDGFHNGLLHAFIRAASIAAGGAVAGRWIVKRAKRAKTKDDLSVQ